MDGRKPNLFNDLSLGAKFAALSVLLFAAVATATIFDVRDALRTNGYLSRSDALAGESAEMAAALDMARAAVRGTLPLRVALSPGTLAVPEDGSVNSDADLAAAGAALTEAAQTLLDRAAPAQPSATSDQAFAPGLPAAAERLAASLSAYRDRLGEATALRGEVDNRADVLRKQGIRMVDAFNALHTGVSRQGEMQATMIGTRLLTMVHELRLRAHAVTLGGGAAEFEAAMDASNAAAALMPALAANLASPPGQRAFGAIEAMLVQFVADLEALASSHRNLAAWGAKLAADVAVIEAEIAAVQSASVAVAGSATRDLSAAGNNALWGAVLAGGCLMLAVVAFGAALVGLVARPLDSFAACLNSLARGGDRDVPSPEARPRGFARLWADLALLVQARKSAAALPREWLDAASQPMLLADPRDGMRIVHANLAARASLPVRAADAHRTALAGVLGAEAVSAGSLADPERCPEEVEVTLPLGGRVTVKLAPVRDAGGRVMVLASWPAAARDVPGGDAFGSSIQATIEDIGGDVCAMHQRIQEISEHLGHTRGKLDDGSSALLETNNTVQLVASAAEALAGSVTEIIGRLTRAAAQAGEASRSTRTVSQRTEELAAASARITDVVASIADITGKTKLLALNATIEAASAGEAGKGFAVVAAEVKRLAEQTALATDEISKEIKEVQGRVTTVVAGVADVADTIEGLREAFAGAASAADRQQEATRAISANAQTAAGGAETAARIIREVQQSASSDHEATKALSDDAKALREANDNLSRRSSEFLASLSAP